ncbi:uncharacterized protein BX663DRAFT_505978 [Cokeromyces recurvatus]|uniref:uncharacterized protein n=1 Tax=Cokeromyces recurvatus TaxID=90255 RepID=UPI00221F8681|nr:uncharacterized protein BX663DRAFT_505978 [Cokeromyces recurvatus]KAI7903980.1 hypothetical protein BX663DRAFT_505978 [Cokeromyces recurvatus]
MPPNTQLEQEAEEMDTPISFVHHFWSKDKTGMKKLINHIKSTHEDLNKVYNIYIERAQIEREFGEKLLLLSEKNSHEASKDGIPAAFDTMVMELKNTANSRLELADKLQQELAGEFESKLEEYKLLLEKWTKSLDELYQERQEMIMELLKTRAKYLKEHEISKGQMTPIMESLKSHYKTLVAEVDEVAQEWNSLWKEACEVMEAMEEDRVEFLKSNIWEYANLTSATLLVQDEWCENIRKQLEQCNVDIEIERCISLCATGSKIPTTNEYVGELMKEQKKKHQAYSERSSKAPTPPTKPHRQQERFSCQSTEQQHRNKENFNSLRNKSDSSRQSNMNYDDQQQQDASTTQSQRRIRDTPSDTEQNTKPSIPTVDQGTYGRNRNPQMNIMQKNVSSNIGSTATRGQIKRKPLNKTLMEQVSNEMAIARQQREIEQRQQKQNDNFSTSSPTIRESMSSHHKSASNGSLESLLKTFEGTNSTATIPSDSTLPTRKSSQSNTSINDEIKSCRQPSEYKPDACSIPTRRGPTTNTPQDNIDDTSSLDKSCPSKMIQEPLSNPAITPKSPRPPPQQIVLDKRPPTDSYPEQQRLGHQTQQVQNYQTTSSPNKMHSTQDPYSTCTYIPPQQFAVGQPSYIGQQHMNQPSQPSPLMQPVHSPMMQPVHSPMMQPAHSPMMQPAHSPMMQPMHSPMMQPVHSPMMQPQRSPMMQQAHSPMMQPMHSPMMQPQRSPGMAPSPLIQPQPPYNTQRGGTLPPPITIPPTTNFAVTPQPSPSISYTNLAGSGGVSPGGVLPPPASPQQLPLRPHQYSDGQPIQFWARAKYDYEASDSDELSFKAHNLIGVLEADITQQSWWLGAIWDEYRQVWSATGSIPSNFMESC